MNIMGSGMWGLGFAIVDARAQKLLKRLVATPMRRGRLPASSLSSSRLVFLIVEVVVVLGFARSRSACRCAGRCCALAVVSLLGALAFGGLGLLSRRRAQDDRRRVAADEPRDDADVGVVRHLLLVRALPGRDAAVRSAPAADGANDALRAVMIEGAGFAGVGSELLVLAGWTVVSFVLALKLFRWE